MNALCVKNGAQFRYYITNMYQLNDNSISLDYHSDGTDCFTNALIHSMTHCLESVQLFSCAKYVTSDELKFPKIWVNFAGPGLDRQCFFMLKHTKILGSLVFSFIFEL